jgi:hypothetical protein
MDLLRTESSEEHSIVELKRKWEQGMRYSQVVGLEGDGVGGDQAWVEKRSRNQVPLAPILSLCYVFV